VQRLDQTHQHRNVLLILQQLIWWLTVGLPPTNIPELHCYLCLVWYHDRMPAPAKVKLFMSWCLIVTDGDMVFLLTLWPLQGRLYCKDIFQIFKIESTVVWTLALFTFSGGQKRGDLLGPKIKLLVAKQDRNFFYLICQWMQTGPVSGTVGFFLNKISEIMDKRRRDIF
jgi:hypothetical protein